MTISLDQFVRQVIQSGAMSAEETSRYQDTFPPEKRPQDTEALAREMIRDEKLTEYQTRLILQGKASELILGEYLLLYKIGKGGMGEVFKGFHRRLERFAALKVLRRDTFGSACSIKRFLQEVKVAARLNHRNIVATYDAGEQNGVHYLAMEYVDGCDLEALLKAHGPLPVPHVLDYVMQTAEGLQYAHSRNVLHRDIKPSNLLLSSEGVIKILDMGLARIAEGDDANAGATLAERLTRAGQMLGTIDYISPEQAKDTRSADHRSDIYSLGCTMYSLLTGKTVYRGDTDIVKVMAHCEAPIPSLRETRPDVPEQLDQALRKMVAKKPEDRYQTMADVIAALETCRDSGAPIGQPTWETFRIDRRSSDWSPCDATVGRWRDGPPLAAGPLESSFLADTTTGTKAAFADDDPLATDPEQPTRDGRPSTQHDP